MMSWRLLRNGLLAVLASLYAAKAAAAWQFSNPLGAGDDHVGQLFTGANGGVFRPVDHDRRWLSVSPSQRSQSLRETGECSYGQDSIVTTPRGFEDGFNNGISWAATRSAGEQTLIAMRSAGNAIVAATRDMLFTSSNDGITWNEMALPAVSYVRSVLIEDQGSVWRATPPSAFHSPAGKWMNAQVVFDRPAAAAFDRETRLVATSSTDTLFVAKGGHRWDGVASIESPTQMIVTRSDENDAGTLVDGVLSIRKPPRTQTIMAGARQ